LVVTKIAAKKQIGLNNFSPDLKTAVTDCRIYTKLETWANSQRDGRPAKYRWHPLFKAAEFG